MDFLNDMLPYKDLPSQIYSSKLRLWLLSVQAFGRLPLSTSPKSAPRTGSEEEGTFMVLTCKTSFGNTVTVVVTDWLPWFRVLSNTDKDAYEILKKTSLMKSGPIQSIHREVRDGKPIEFSKACGWEPVSPENMNTKTFPSTRITVKGLYGIAPALRALKYSLGDQFSDPPSQSCHLEAVDTAQRPVARFLNDLNLRTSSWFNLTLQSEAECGRLTNSWELRTECKNIVQTAEDLQDMSVPPLYLASFDGEMSSFSRRLPCPFMGDKLFCLSTCFSVVRGGEEPKYKIITLYLYPRAKDPEVLLNQDQALHQLLFFTNFKDLLEFWTSLLQKFDCDFGPTGWNTESFDWPFLYKSYTQSFLQPQLRGSEELHLEIFKLLGKPQQSVRDLCGKLTNAQKLQVKQMISIEEEFTPLLNSLLKASEDKSKGIIFLNSEEDADEVEEEEEDDKHFLKNPQIHIPLREACTKVLGLETPVWTPNEEIYRGLKAKFGKDAASFMCSHAWTGTPHALYLSRFKNKQCCLQTKRLSTAAKGDNIMEKILRDGSIVFDTMRIYKDSEKPNSMALRAAADAHLKNVSKLDMPIEELFDIYDKTLAMKKEEDDTELLKSVVRIADYCGRDAEIPLRIISTLKYLEGWIGLSRACNLPLEAIVNGGQQARVFSELSWRIKDSHYINFPETPWPQNSTKYQGATVMNPIAGFYKDPVSTLDFQSLYPSIIITNNLCPSTLVNCSELQPILKARGLSQTFTITHERGDGSTFDRSYTFVTHVPSVFADLLQGLLMQRKVTKKEMEAEKDPFKYEILNKLQLAYKMVCNSAYGYCGSSVGSVWGPFFPVAAVTTLIGRTLIADTRKFIETKFMPSLEVRPIVVYGDTDSVMIYHGPGVSLEQAFWRAEDAAREVTKFLQEKLLEKQGVQSKYGRSAEDMVKVLKLEHEKEMCPLLLCDEKKNYAYRHFTPKLIDADKKITWKVKTDIKGLQCVRRDTVPYVTKLTLKVLDILLLEGNIEKALKEEYTVLSDLVDNKLPLEDLVVSKSVAAHYKVAQPHISARNKQAARGEEIPPVGGRMPFIICMGKSMAGLGLTDRAEHPDFLRKHSQGGLRPDIQYYLKASFNALRKIHKNAESGKLESIIQSVTQRASNVGNKKLLAGEICDDLKKAEMSIIEDFFHASPGKQRRQELESALEIKVVKKVKKQEAQKTTKMLF
jgi:DNA polymerase elongation subunit (family B)